MKKLFKIFIAAVLSTSLLFSSSLTASAADLNEGIMPCYDYASNCSPSFNINASGRGVTELRYLGNSDSFREVKVSVKLEKQILWLFWVGFDNNVWSTSSTDLNGYLYHIFDLDGTGLYKATFTIQFIGIDGSVNNIEEIIERRYS